MKESYKRVLMNNYRWVRFSFCPEDIKILSLDVIRERGCSFNLSTGYATHPIHGCHKIPALAHILLKN